MAKDKHRTAEFWNEHAHPFYSYKRRTAYCDEFLRRAKIKPGETVLDMGCGSGTLCIPLSDEGHEVFCADFSQGMLNTVEEVIATEGITNLKTKLLSWEDDWEAAQIPICDVAIASRSLLAEDIEDAVAKLDAHAKRRVCITTRAQGDVCWTNRVEAFLGRPSPSTFDFARVVKAALDLGRMVEVDYMIDKRVDIFPTKVALIEHLKHKAKHIDSFDIPKFEEYCNMYIEEYKDENNPEMHGWVCNDGAFSAWAFISWNKFIDDNDINKDIVFHSSEDA